MKITLNPFVVMREEFDGSGIVFNPENNKIMVLNSTGVVLWKTLQHGASPDKALQVIMNQFNGVTPEQATADIGKFIDELEDRGILSKNLSQ